MAVVMVDNICQGGEPPIVVKTALAVREQAAQRSGTVTLFAGTAFGLKIVYADFLGRMQVPARLGEQGRNVASGTLCFGIEKLLSPAGCRAVKAVCRGSRRRQRQLIVLQRRELGGYIVRRPATFSQLGLHRDWISRDVQPLVDERAAAVHLRNSD